MSEYKFGVKSLQEFYQFKNNCSVISAEYPEEKIKYSMHNFNKTIMEIVSESRYISIIFNKNLGKDITFEYQEVFEDLVEIVSKALSYPRIDKYEVQEEMKKTNDDTIIVEGVKKMRKGIKMNSFYLLSR